MARRKKALHNALSSFMRRFWMYNDEARKAVIARTRVGHGSYRCEGCGKKCEKIAVDHIRPVGVTPGSKNDKGGRTWEDYIGALFCPVENLMGLCSRCHGAKTKKEAAARAS